MFARCGLVVSTGLGLSFHSKPQKSANHKLTSTSYFFFILMASQRTPNATHAMFSTMLAPP